jgi:hypothetical protein
MGLKLIGVSNSAESRSSSSCTEASCEDRRVAAS